MRRQWHIRAGVLLLLAFPAMAQEAEQPATPEATAEQQKQQLLDEAVQAAREINMVRIIQALRLTGVQAQAIVQHMEAIQKAKQEIAAESGPIPKRTLDSVRDVLTAWMQLEPVDVAKRTAVSRALDSRARSVGPRRAEIAAQIHDVKISVLTPEQQQVILAAAPEEQGQGPGVDERTVDRVVQAIQLAAQAEPQVFEQRLDANAQAIAGAIVGQGTPLQVQMAARVKELLIQLQPLTKEQWQQQADQTRQTITTSLGLATPTPGQGDAQPATPEGDVVPESSFDAFLQDARALELLKQIVAAAQAAPAPHEGDVDADPVRPTDDH